MTDLSDRLGVTPRHLNRLFKKYLGASAKAIGQTRRLQFAKRLIDETELTMTEVAMSAGYGSIRRFNDHFKRTYGRAPASLRNGSPSLASTKEAAPAREAVTLRLAYRAPFDFAGLLRFYSMRAIPGVEQVTADAYSRAWDLGGSDTERRLGWVKISDDPASSSLVLQVCGVPPSDLMQLVSRVRQVFDLDALPAEINCVLNADKGFAQLAKSNPGQRLPGGWDPFETAVRAIVGQQISVKAATTVMGKIAAYWGESTGAMRSFPGPERLAEMSTASLPMPTARAETIRRLAQAVRDGKLVLAPAQEAEALVATLTAIKGIGPWTAQYIAMRALGDPDTFLHGDLVIKKTAARHLGLTSERALLARAEAWRPWRAYAGMHLWRLAGQHSD